jgi:hypothetical protein
VLIKAETTGQLELTAPTENGEMQSSTYTFNEHIEDLSRIIFRLAGNYTPVNYKLLNNNAIELKFTENFFPDPADAKNYTFSQSDSEITFVLIKENVTSLPSEINGLWKTNPTDPTSITFEVEKNSYHFPIHKEILMDLNH